ncbi:MAG: 6-phosphogluconolactonase [Candidatus Viridilinea halotolerans]|uniref:6-phosphogluconolactonase n=1 Tax=Candidatus Viridilinea halotolerans TaxID=2491704 RepID=A0A426TWI0_9CHLR|nr:MAG: 6-phosphogluconolactonase [Candidatus Viridilinea halotolerans]
MHPAIIIASSIEALQITAAERMAGVLTQAVSRRGRALVALSGGTLPPGVFRYLTTEPLRSQIPWHALSIVWADERLVSFTDPASNYTLTRQTLLDHVPIPSAQVFPVATYYDGPQAAVRYQDQLEVLLSLHNERLDLVLLGMGADGHTASLFPTFPQLSAPPTQLVAFVEHAPKPPPQRVTLTAHTLNLARETIFLVAGSDKAPKVHTALHGLGDPQHNPTQLIRPPNAQITWMLDTAAAARLG